MIVSFGNKTTEDLYHGHQTKRVRQIPANLSQATLRKLDVLNAAYRIEDLAMPPGNHLKALKGDLEGFHSIRVNDQWRLIFRWHNNNAHDVSLVDYH